MQPLILLGLTLPLLILSSFCAEGQVNNDHKIIEFTTEGLCEPLQAYRPWCPPGVPCSTRLSWSDHYLYISSFKGHQRMYKLLMPPRSSGLSTVISAVPTAFEYTENARVIVISRWKNSALTFVTYTYLNDQRQNPLTYSFGKDRDIVDAFCHLGYVYLVIRVKSTVSKVTQYSWSFVEVPIKDMDEFNDVLNYRVINNAETVFNKSKVIDEVKGTFDNGVNITYVISANKFIFIQGGVQFTSTINSFKDVIIVAPSLTDLDAIYKKITPSDICALVLLRLLDQYQNAKIVHYTLGMDLTKADVVVGLPSSCVSGPA